ncbi:MULTISPECIES: hypothetical protein [Flavobacteriaceae]|uniref:hypothetical protein n=1 Tax=Flavobacteriaceae TaxID=49546 RepID=UPI0014915773|nr:MULTISPECIES: hypothetical protein [Allomuricauda]MDC6367482.1 hypothetical protein [Muricauda sp. AC10]
MRSYFKFLLKSTNAHGVHSPFVFNYVTQCLYSKKKLNQNKSINVLLKSIRYFNAKNAWVEGNPTVKQSVQAYNPSLDWNTSPFDVLYFETLHKAEFITLLSKGKIHNDSLIFISKVHENTLKHEIWKELIALEEVTVSIDMFHLGVLSIRKEQAKQHFTIRI